MSANKTRRQKVGELIEIIDYRNSDGHDYDFFGINKDKVFMPTVADTNGLDNTKYKIVEKGTFVFSGMQTGRDVCIRIALYSNDTPIIVSPAYTTFKIKDQTVVIPEYLFIQFNRFEMDRYGWFLSDGSVRSNLDWDRFCEIEIPLPSIDIQQELVDTYSGLKALAEQNEAIIEPLSKACEALIANCKSKYAEVCLKDHIEESFEQNTLGNLHLDDVRGVSINKEFIDTKANMDNVPLDRYKIVRNNMFVFNVNTARMGDKFAIAFCKNQTYLVSSIYGVFKCKESSPLLPEYLFIHLKRNEFDRYVRFNSWGSARETFTMNEMYDVRIPLPPEEVQQSIINLYNCLEEAKAIAAEAREKLKTLCPALVQRAANS